jgi:DNA-binding MarR family transcriptional regulator
MKNDESESLSENIITAIEKISQINRLILWDISKEENLSPIQIQFIDYINRMPLQMSTISNLAMEFDLKKSTVSDSISNLIKKGFLEKKQDKQDKRIFYLYLTKSSFEKISIIEERNKKIYEKLD